MNSKHIIKSLPLLASVLGRKYGVQVYIGGDNAFTNGSIIQLPSLPRDCDETLLGLVRGLIDHESAHIRATDFEALKAANLTPLEKHIWNTIEDWRVENILSAVYPGCGENFRWLIKHLFLPKSVKRKHNKQITDPAMLIPEWLLITVRSWDVQELAKERERLRAAAEIHYPGLTHELKPILCLIPTNCSSTLEALSFAHDITAVIRKYAQVMEQRNQKSEAQQSLCNILSAGVDDAMFPEAIGETLQKILTGACAQQGERLRVAVPTRRQKQPFESSELLQTLQETTALRTRLHALMQSTRSVRNRNGYAGVLDTCKLHRLPIGDTRVFLRRGERSSVNTAVHILLDASGSMDGASMQLANQACFAVASALHGIKGISVGATAFPGEKVRPRPECGEHWNTVAPVLRHNEQLHTFFVMNAAGGTPLDAAVWWALQQMYTLPEPRKIILLITDGSPDSKSLTLEAIAAVKSCSIEMYGIGIQNNAIQDLLPPGDSQVINTLQELAPAMFGVLRRALIPH